MTQNNNKLSGKLELNWVNKNKTLIVKDYEKGSYEWVDRNDYRVSEVRLLKEMEKFGEKNANSFIQNSADNLIICGDSLNALTSLTKIPKYRQKYVNKVKLIYIDPPFNTGQMFANYDDQLEHSVWLTMMRDRVLKTYELLSDDGSLWVHLDDTELYHFKLVLDEIFGKENFVANAVWQKNYSPKGLSKFISFSHDNLLIFAKDKERLDFNRLPRSAKMDKLYKNPDNDPRGSYKMGDFTIGEITKNRYDITTPAGKTISPPAGRSWRMNEDRFKELNKDNCLWWGKDKNNVPSIKFFLSEASERMPTTWWPHEEVGHNDEAKKEILKLFSEIEPFATPKPERLLQRIIQMLLMRTILCWIILLVPELPPRWLKN